MPNETWQSDFTHYRLTNPDGTPGTDVEVITWLDDHSRYALHVSAHHRITANDRAGHVPRSHRPARLSRVHADRQRDGLHRPVRRRPRRAQPCSRTNCGDSDIVQKNSRPNHPTTCGKVERFQQTMKKWLRAQPAQPATIAELQELLDRFRQASTTTTDRTARCHTEQPRPPPTSRARRPPQAPTATRDTHDRVRFDRIDKSAPSPCASPADSTTSASAEPTPEPTSSCSSRTSTYASSTPPPASSSAT